MNGKLEGFVHMHLLCMSYFNVLFLWCQIFIIIRLYSSLVILYGSLLHLFATFTKSAIFDVLVLKAEIIEMYISTPNGTVGKHPQNT